MKEETIKQRPWFLLTGLALGIGLGLLTAWYLYPVERIDTHPATMRSDFKDYYRVMIAAAFEANGDLGRAKARLGLLQDNDPQEALSRQAQVMMADGGSPQEARALGLLAAALAGSKTGADDRGGEAGGGIGSTPETSTTPRATQTPLPSATPTATQGAPFAVELFSETCDASLPGPLIQVFVFDAARQPVPGIEVVVRWDGGEDRFFTGLKIEVGPGYADFLMEPEVIYSVGLTLGDQPVGGISTRECDVVDGNPVYSSWVVNFVQP